MDREDALREAADVSSKLVEEDHNQTDERMTVSSIDELQDIDDEFAILPSEDSEPLDEDETYLESSWLGIDNGRRLMSNADTVSTLLGSSDHLAL